MNDAQIAAVLARVNEGRQFHFDAEDVRAIAAALAAPAEGGQGEVVDLGEVIREKVREHGSYRAASKAIGVNYPYLCQMAHDPNRKPSKEILAALGLERVTVTRRLIDSAGGAKGETPAYKHGYREGLNGTAIHDGASDDFLRGYADAKGGTPQPAEGDGASPTTVRFIDGGIVQMDRADYDKLTRPSAAAAVDDAMVERACRAHDAYMQDVHGSGNEADDFAIRAALTAALANQEAAGNG